MRESTPRGQVASFHCENPMPCGEILRQLRRYLPEDIGIYSCQEAAPRFHARLNAKKKTYCYRIWNSDSPCVFDRRYMTVLVEPLDLDAMKAASKALLGQHDFTCFCTRAPKKKSTVREIFDISITRTDAEVDISVTADGFLYNMMRILIGTLVEVGLGRRRADSIPDLFIQKRAEAGTLMPAKGLCLMEVVY